MSAVLASTCPSPNSRIVLTPIHNAEERKPSRFPTNGINLIVEASHLYHLAQRFDLVTQSWRDVILEVIQGTRRPETADVNTAKASIGGTEGFERTIRVRATLTIVKWDKSNKNLYAFLYLTVGKAGEATAANLVRFHVIIKVRKRGDP